MQIYAFALNYSNILQLVFPSDSLSLYEANYFFQFPPDNFSGLSLELRCAVGDGKERRVTVDATVNFPLASPELLPLELFMLTSDDTDPTDDPVDEPVVCKLLVELNDDFRQSDGINEPRLVLMDTGVFSSVDMLLNLVFFGVTTIRGLGIPVTCDFML